VLIALAIVSVTRKLTDTPRCIYFNGSQFGQFLLGAATMALVLLLYLQ
jgi:putative effector of murein hydrolase